jgi:hypothetical protein
MEFKHIPPESFLSQRNIEIKGKNLIEMNRMSSRKMSQIDFKSEKPTNLSKTSRDDISSEKIKNRVNKSPDKIKGIDFRKTTSREKIPKTGYQRLLPMLNIDNQVTGRSNYKYNQRTFIYV